MTASKGKLAFSGLARRLVLDGLMDEAATQEAFEKASLSKTPFVIYLGLMDKMGWFF